MIYEVIGKKFEWGVPIHSQHTITEYIQTGWSPPLEEGLLVARAEDLIKDLERAKVLYKNKNPTYRIISVRYTGVR